MKKIHLLTASSLLFVLPFFASAQVRNVTGLIGWIRETINLLIPLLIAIALIAFFWGLVKYIWAAGDGDAQKQGKSIMVAGIIGLFLMVGIWGIIGILENTFTGNVKTVKPPQAPGTITSPNAF